MTMHASSGSDRDERHPPAKKRLIKAMCLQVEVSGESTRPKPDS